MEPISSPPIHFLLEGKISEWNKWRNYYHETRVALSGLKIPGGKLKGVDLSDCDVFFGDFYEADLSGADLSGTEFFGSYFRRANFYGAGCSRTDFTGTVLDDANFETASIDPQTFGPPASFVGIMGVNESFEFTHFGAGRENWPDLMHHLCQVIESSPLTVRPEIARQLNERTAELERLQTKLSTLEEAMRSAQAQLPQIGIGKQAQSFEDARKANDSDAGSWFKWVFGGALIMVVLAVGDTVTLHAGWYSVQASMLPLLISLRIITYSVLSFFVIWSARNYRAAIHNREVNRHRTAALRTFPSLMEGSDSSDYKEYLLLIAADAAYRDRPTGYDAKEAEAQHTNPLLDSIIKSVASAAVGKGQSK